MVHKLTEVVSKPMQVDVFVLFSPFPPQDVVFVKIHRRCQASLVAQLVKNPPSMQETRVRSLGREESLEKGMETHSRILAWSIPQTEEPGRLQSIGWLTVPQD